MLTQLLTQMLAQFLPCLENKNKLCMNGITFKYLTEIGWISALVLVFFAYQLEKRKESKN